MRKFIIAVKLPSGTRYAWSSFENQFALVPISDSGAVRKASAFDTRTEAEDHRERQLEIAPDLARMGEHEVIEVQLPQLTLWLNRIKKSDPPPVRSRRDVVRKGPGPDRSALWERLRESLKKGIITNCRCFYE